jgi:hypothetical protein
MTAIAIALTAAGIVGLGTIYKRDLRRDRSRRRLSLSRFAGLFDDARLSYEANDYPVLRGQALGQETELRLVVDILQARKLPVLWLHVTIKRPLAVCGAIDLMARATNAEIDSPYNAFVETLPLPPDWPDQVTIRGQNLPVVAPILRQIEPEVRAFFGDTRAKELLLTRKGIRLVYRFNESDRGHYLMTRTPKFDQNEIGPDAVERLLALAKSIGNGLEAER